MQAWCCKPSKSPIYGEVIGQKKEPNTVILLYRHGVKPPSKYIFIFIYIYIYRSVLPLATIREAS